MRLRHPLVFALACFLTAGFAVAEAQQSFNLPSPISAEEIKLGGETCGDNNLYEQSLASFNTARTSDAGSGPPSFEVADAHLVGGVITPINAAVGTSRFWGIDIDFSGGGPALCGAPEPTAPFTVTFYADAGGQPGAQIAQVTGVAPTVTETGIAFAFTTIQRYDLSFPAVDTTGAAWVSYLREVGPDANCFFLWVDEDSVGTFDDIAFQFTGAPPQLDTYQAFCLGGMGAPTLSLDDVSVVDSCVDPMANENGILEPGEGATLTIELGAANADFSNISCTLSSTSPGVEFEEDTSTYPDLTDGSSGTNDTPFVFTLNADDAVCFSDLDLDLDCTSSEGPFSFSFTEPVGQGLTASGLPAAIPDDDPGGVTSVLMVGDDVTLSDVDVRVQITHTWVGDLLITLESPMGTTVTLLDRPGVPNTAAGCGDNNMDVTFDDAAGGDLESLCSVSNDTTPWFVGSGPPTSPLSAFNGESSMGPWSLFVSDNAGQDTGTIDDWELITDPAIGGTCNTCNDSGIGGPIIPPTDIPTLDTVGLAGLVLLLMAGAVFVMRRRL